MSEVGNRYGRLIVMERAEDAPGSHRRWRCLCDCGADITVRQADLRTGSTQSCGCLRREIAKTNNTKHGEGSNGKETPEYHAWDAMKQRCYNPNHDDYNNYGGRGILVCEQWRESYETFLKDVGRRPGTGYSLDRVDNLKGYEPENIRWATSTQQNRNHRGNKILSIGEESHTLSEWSEITGLNYNTLLSRLRMGWSTEETLLSPKTSRWERSRRNV